MNGVLFDCDGVLVDSERLSCGAWLPVLARHGLAVELAEIEQLLGKSDAAVLEQMRRVHGVSLGEEVIAERLREYFRSARGRLVAFPGLVSALRALQARAVPLAVASSGSFAKIRFSLQEAGLASFFSVVCSATEVELGKPAPDLFLLAARRLGLAAECCTVVEDSLYGIVAARAAGMRALGFSSSVERGALLEAGAEQVFGDYAELLPLLARWWG